MDSESMFDKMMRDNPIGMTKAMIAAHIQSALHMHPVTDEQADAALAQLWPVIAARIEADARKLAELEAAVEALKRSRDFRTAVAYDCGVQAGKGARHD